MLGAKVMALGLAFSGWLLWRQFRRALRDRHVGPAHRRTHRTHDPRRYYTRVASRAAGALVCFVAAWLCLAEFRHHF
jgi:hypothetical protein